MMIMTEPLSRHFPCCKTWWIKNLNLNLLMTEHVSNNGDNVRKCGLMEMKNDVRYFAERMLKHAENEWKKKALKKKKNGKSFETEKPDCNLHTREPHTDINVPIFWNSHPESWCSIAAWETLEAFIALLRGQEEAVVALHVAIGLHKVSAITQCTPCQPPLDTAPVSSRCYLRDQQSLYVLFPIC